MSSYFKHRMVKTYRGAGSGSFHESVFPLCQSSFSFRQLLLLTAQLPLQLLQAFQCLLYLTPYREKTQEVLPTQKSIHLHANIKIGNHHFVITPKCTFDLKEFDCNFYLCQQVVLYAKQSNAPHKAFSVSIYKQVCEVRPECPPPQPLCPQKPYQPLPKPLHTHSQNFPPARIDFSTTLMRSVSRMSHPPSSSPLLLFTLFPFLSVHFSLHALQLC